MESKAWGWGGPGLSKVTHELPEGELHRVNSGREHNGAELARDAWATGTGQPCNRPWPLGVLPKTTKTQYPLPQHSKTIFPQQKTNETVKLHWLYFHYSKREFKGGLYSPLPQSFSLKNSKLTEKLYKWYNQHLYTLFLDSPTVSICSICFLSVTLPIHV